MKCCLAEVTCNKSHLGIVYGYHSGGSSPQHLGGEAPPHAMASAVTRFCNGGLGSEPPAGSRDRAPDGQGVRRQSPHEAEALLAIRRSIEASNLPTFLKFGNAKKSHIYVIFARNHGWLRNWGPEAKLGGEPVPPSAQA